MATINKDELHAFILQVARESYSIITETKRWRPLGVSWSDIVWGIPMRQRRRSRWIVGFCGSLRTSEAREGLPSLDANGLRLSGRFLGRVRMNVGDCRYSAPRSLASSASCAYRPTKTESTMASCAVRLTLVRSNSCSTSLSP
jgi:hypothetical protein